MHPITPTLVLIAFAGCTGESPAPPTSPSATGLGTTASAPTSEGAPMDASWKRAIETQEDAELATLAGREGALGLASALGDPIREAVARRALVFAHDVDEAFLPIAERVALAKSVEADLDLLLQLTARPQRFGERLDPAGDARVLGVLDETAAKASEPRVRGKAQTLITRLRERGLAR